MIREYKEQDLDDLLAAWSSASELAHPFLTDEFIASERENIPNIYLPITETWVAEVNQRVVGFVSLLGKEVGALFVHPDYHGRGFGWRLMDKARELRGELDVDVFEANMIGRKFYEKYGFEHVEERIHEETGHKLLRLRLAASSPAT